MKRCPNLTSYSDGRAERPPRWPGYTVQAVRVGENSLAASPASPAGAEVGTHATPNSRGRGCRILALLSTGDGMELRSPGSGNGHQSEKGRCILAPLRYK